MKFVSDDNLLYIWQKIKSLLGGKVDKVDGKGLSTNDYTNTDMTKLSGIETGAQVNDIETISVNNIDQTITNKKVNINVPTATSGLTNDSGFITKDVNELTNFYDKTTVNELIGDISTVSFQIVAELPSTGASNIIYLILDSDGEAGNIYDEYIYINNAWEKIGSTDIDLIQYSAGTNIEITEDGVINNTIPDNKLIPLGGESEAVLMKASANDYDVKWQTLANPLNADYIENMGIDDTTMSDRYYVNKPDWGQLPSGDLIGFVDTKRVSETNLLQTFISSTTGKLYSRTYNGTSWSEWRNSATVDELSNTEIDEIFES